jgi:hypothetical protein
MEQTSPFELIVAVILPPITASSLYVGSRTYTPKFSQRTSEDERNIKTANNGALHIWKYWSIP